MSDVFRGFAELEVFVDNNFVHLRQQDKMGSWIVIPHHLWPAIVASVTRQVGEELTESTE